MKRVQVFRGWARRNRRGLTVVSAVVIVVLFVAFMLRGAGWLYGPGLSKLKPDQQVTAIDDVRGRMIQVATGVLAIGALVFTWLNYGLSREGHVTDRFSKAIEQLGSDSLDVRLGAIYALERIMADSPRDHPTIVEVLAAYVREHAKLAGQKKRFSDHAEQGGEGVPPPYTDVQAALTVLGRRPPGREERGNLNLQSTDLAGANLIGAVLRSVNLIGADPTKANVTSADLTEANLSRATLTEANLTSAILLGADFSYATMPYVVLNHAHLVGADFGEAEMPNTSGHKADLAYADLSSAILTRAQLTNADLTHADLTGAILNNALLMDADLAYADLTGANLRGVKMGGAKLTNANVNQTDLDSVDLANVDLTGVDLTTATGLPPPPGPA